MRSFAALVPCVLLLSIALPARAAPPKTWDDIESVTCHITAVGNASPQDPMEGLGTFTGSGTYRLSASVVLKPVVRGHMFDGDGMVSVAWHETGYRRSHAMTGSVRMHARLGILEGHYELSLYDALGQTLTRVDRSPNGTDSRREPPPSIRGAAALPGGFTLADEGTIAMPGASGTPAKLMWRCDGVGTPRSATFSAIPPSWLPEAKTSPNAVVETTVTWPGFADRICAELTSSQEHGTSINSQDADPSPDLELDASMRAAGWQFVDCSGAPSPTQRHARIDGQRSGSIKVVMRSRDYGAFGSLQVRVRVDGEWLHARLGDQPSLTLPVDADGDHIGDAWESPGDRQPLADDETVPGQSAGARGDGLTEYEEYRGAEFLENGALVHRRLDPTAEDVFVVDPAGLLDVPVASKASGLEFHVMPAANGGAERRLNHRSTFYGTVGPQRHLVLERAVGETDPHPGAHTGRSDPTQLGYTLPDGSTGVNDTDFSVIYPDKAPKSVETLIRDLRYLIGDDSARPNDDARAALDAIRAAKTYNEIDLGRLLAFLKTPQGSQAYQKYLVELATLHEILHAVGAPHHAPIHGGAPLCPVKYLTLDDKVEIVRHLRGNTPPPPRDTACSVCNAKIRVSP